MKTENVVSKTFQNNLNPIPIQLWNLLFKSNIEIC